MKANLKASELRVGNYVMCCFDDKDGWFNHKVTAVFDNNTINTDCGSERRYYYEPIPLTPEILEKCGFVRHYDDRLWYKLSDNEVRFTLWSYLIPDSYCFKFMTFRSSEIYHLHQLQNLYHSLTQTELNVEIL